MCFATSTLCAFCTCRRVLVLQLHAHWAARNACFFGQQLNKLCERGVSWSHSIDSFVYLPLPPICYVDRKLPEYQLNGVRVVQGLHASDCRRSHEAVLQEVCEFLQSLAVSRPY